jgi:hypothetical protein
MEAPEGPAICHGPAVRSVAHWHAWDSAGPEDRLKKRAQISNWRDLRSPENELVMGYVYGDVARRRQTHDFRTLPSDLPTVRAVNKRTPC